MQRFHQWLNRVLIVAVLVLGGFHAWQIYAARQAEALATAEKAKDDSDILRQNLVDQGQMIAISRTVRNQVMAEMGLTDP